MEINTQVLKNHVLHQKGIHATILKDLIHIIRGKSYVKRQNFPTSFGCCHFQENFWQAYEFTHEAYINTNYKYSRPSDTRLRTIGFT